MAHTAQRARIDADRLRAIQSALRDRGLDGWLLYDYHSTNPVAGRLLGLEQPLTRRYFVFLPAEGRPVAVVHALERAPWQDWPGSVRVYFTWQELESVLSEALTPGQQVAIEYSENDRIPQLDRTPAGVLDLVRRAGVHPRGSGELVTLFVAAWSDAELESHRRSAAILADVARTTFGGVAAAIRQGERPTEWSLKRRVLEALGEEGLVDVDAIVAAGPNSANGHYEPTADQSAPVEPEQVLLLDLWGREPNSVFADQTWMAYTGAEVPDRALEVWNAVKGARDAAVQRIEDANGGDGSLRGCDVDEASRAVIREAGMAESFTHRTGHSIDILLHGLGPNIDSVETRDERTLLPGIGFSIEPGVYLSGAFGVRSEINVYLGPDGPQVTTPNAQTAIFPLLDDSWQKPNSR